MAAFVPARVAGRAVEHAIDEEERHAPPCAPEPDAAGGRAQDGDDPDDGVADRRPVGALHQLLHRLARDIGVIPLGRGQPGLDRPRACFRRPGCNRALSWPSIVTSRPALRARWRAACRRGISWRAARRPPSRCSMMIGMFGCFSVRRLQIEVVVQRAEAGRRQLDLADAAEGVALERVRVADIGMLLRLVAAGALHVLGVARS